MKQKFVAANIERILSILIPHVPCEGKMASLQNYGAFTVKRAYWFGRLLCEMNSNFVSTSNASGGLNNKVWKAIWSPYVVPKVSIWAWKVARDKLFTRTNLPKRCILLDSSPVVCTNLSMKPFAILSLAVILLNKFGAWQALILVPRFLNGVFWIIGCLAY